MLLKMYSFLILASLFGLGLSQSVCSPNPCYNNGQCYQATSTTGYCACLSGYTGSLCEISNNCLVNPCLNSGSCFSTGADYFCSCPSSFYGPQCQYTNSNPCNLTPCLNNGTCSINYSVSPVSYSCTCANGYSGNNCQLTPTVNCLDSNIPSCQFFAANNLCSSIYAINGVTIPTYCPKSCNVCSTTSTSTSLPPSCTDTYSGCSSWVASNYCNLYPVYSLCKSSCNLC